MADITIYGGPRSTYVRTVRMTCEEKGVGYELAPLDPGSPAHLELHPFAKAPAMKHGDFVLFETAAIARYIDQVFPGGRLIPAEAKAAARATQWMSAVSDYGYQVMIRELVWQRLIVPARGGAPDQAIIDAALPKLGRQLAVLDAALADFPWLAGEALTLADLMLAPILFYVLGTPEGRRAIEDRVALRRWYTAISARPSFKATMPELPRSAAAE